MIDGNQLREEFGRYLAEHKATRWGMDAALMHVCKIAYDAGKADEQLHAHIQRGAVPEGDDGKRVLREVFALCEDTETQCSHAPEELNDFNRGRAFEAKGIARAIGAWYQEEFCGRTHMGEPAAPDHSVVQKQLDPDISRILADNMHKMYEGAAPDHSAPAPAEVPMPEPVAYGFGNTAITGHTNRLMMVRLDVPLDDQYAGAFWLPLVLADEARTYGDAREAAGYARGLKEAGKLRTKLFVLRSGIKEYLEYNNTDGFACTCTPETECYPHRQKVLRDLLAD